MKKAIPFCLIFCLFNTHAAVKPLLILSSGLDLVSFNQSYTTVNYPGSFDGYLGKNNNQVSPVNSVFLGFEFNVTPSLLLQEGVNYYSSVSQLQGDVLLLGEPSWNGLTYLYKIRSQRVFLETKILGTFHRLHPYVVAGVGGVFNKSHAYSEYPNPYNGGNAVPMTVPFSAQSQRYWSYDLGAGVDMDVMKNMRLGLAYHFANLKRSCLGTTSLQTDTAYLKAQSLYSHEFLVALSLVGEKP